MQSNRLFLFLPNTFAEWLLAIFFRDFFIHAAIEVGGVRYDSDPRRGSFGLSDVSLDGRKVVEIEFGGDLFNFVQGMSGRVHQWRGVWGWLRACRRRSLYSFDMVWLALKSAGIVSGNAPVRVTGMDLLRAVLAHQAVLANGAAVAHVRQLLRGIRFQHEVEIWEAMQGARGEVIANMIIASLADVTGAGSVAEAITLMHSRRSLLLRVEERLHVLMGPIRRMVRGAAAR